MTIGDRLKTLRQTLNMTAKDFANVLNIPVRTIGGYERNENPPNEKFLTQLIEKFNVNINWLLTGYGGIFIANKSDLASLIKELHNISNTEAHDIVELIENKSTREFILRFSKAKQGDIKSVDILMQNLAGIKVVFS